MHEILLSNRKKVKKVNKNVCPLAILSTSFNHRLELIDAGNSHSVNGEKLLSAVMKFYFVFSRDSEKRQ